MLKARIIESEKYPDTLIKYEDERIIVFFYKKKFIRVGRGQRYSNEQAMEEFNKENCEICIGATLVFRYCSTCAKSICSNCISRLSKPSCPYCRTDL